VSSHTWDGKIISIFSTTELALLHFKTSEIISLLLNRKTNVVSIEAYFGSSLVASYENHEKLDDGKPHWLVKFSRDDNSSSSSSSSSSV